MPFVNQADGPKSPTFHRGGMYSGGKTVAALGHLAVLARLACLPSHSEPTAPKGPQPSEVRASWPRSTDGRLGLICMRLFGAGRNYVLVGGGSHPNVDPPPQTPSAILDISVKLNESHQSAEDGNPLPDCPTGLCRHPLRLPVERTA